MKRLYLHYGMHKTGSTSIQNYLDRNESFFADKGFHIVRDLAQDGSTPGMGETNCARLAHLAIRRELVTPSRFTGRVPSQVGDRSQTIAEANAALHGFDGDRLIMSAEAFSFMRTEGERAALDRLLAGFDVVPVGYLREAADFLKSWEARLTSMKVHQQPGTVDGEGILDLRPDSWLVDHDAIRAFFGSRGIYLSYEAAMRDAGNVVPAFLGAIGVDPADSPAWGQVWANRTGG